MVKYSEVDEELKNGYHLADILTKACFVAVEDRAIYKVFSTKVKETRQKHSNETHQQVLEQLKEDIKNFNIAKDLKRYEGDKSLNIKRMIYRSVTLFISALGQLNNYNNNINFVILEDLHQRNIIDDETFHDLSFAVAFACIIRLHQYMRMQAQDDSVSEFSEDFFRSRD